jgi:DNA replication protein DnaC
VRRAGASALHPAIDLDCRQCRGLGAVILRDGEVAVATRCDCVGRCPACNDGGWIAPDGGILGRGVKRIRCACMRLPSRIEKFNLANIPGRHATSTLATFKPATKELTVAMRAVAVWIKGFKRREETRGLVLYGDVGRGKTHLLVAAVREVIFVHGATARFVEFSHLLADIKSGFDRGQGMGATVDDLVGCDVLAIDELGKGRNNEFEGTVLDELISRRYNAARTVIGTTNFPPVGATGRPTGDLVSGDLPALADRVGPRVFSRFREMCDFQPVVGDDWRLKVPV